MTDKSRTREHEEATTTAVSEEKTDGMPEEKDGEVVSDRMDGEAQEVASNEPVEALPEDIGKLRQMLEDERAWADESRERAMRLQAELENTRRRAERDVESAHKYALDRFTAELLPVKDSLELGLAAVGEGHDSVDKIREGTELTLKMFAGVLERFGIKEVNPLEMPFDPALHQAMTMQPSAEHAPNTVLAVMQKGYTLNDRLVRPAMVVVSKAAE